MITVLTEFKAKDAASAEELESIFKKLIQETPSETGCISYEINTVQDKPTTYYILERWASTEDLQNHALTVAQKGYVIQAVALIENNIENQILQILK
ncbi:antibiotic biosynthesis monooxygenase [Fulvivirga maritima]|uniref:putative quinol monooxygenase n=1 Tax=Fulvivirga maritima TaxID=2904247 RepID=UPI001F167854|nr:antibiotic biosynthesis monooxygenase [Fulvivirga maritima]UII26734.1 antibiotic biosynthesis monooxygenase [Fulvivirga maritima]